MKTTRERFEAKFVKGDGCWNWTAYKDPNSYGRLRIAGRSQLAHRVSYQLYVGEIPDGLFCLHRCDNPACVRPDHLFLGTDADNMHDCMNKGRIAAGENNGRAKLTEEQVKKIRARRDDGALQIDLAKEFGVARSNISKIVLRLLWAKL